MSSKYALEIDNVTKTYSNGVQALKGISLKIEKGDFYALLGHNGAGKSTLIGIISSIVNKTQGNVKVFGKNLDEDPFFVKSNIGIVNQEFNMNVHDKVEEVLIYSAGYFGIPLSECKRRAEHWLKVLNLSDKSKDTIMKLSGGMKRRVMIARALMHHPKLLILDEPTAGVDISLRRDMWDFLREINKQGVTIILTTHYLEEAEYLCNNIGIISHGELKINTSIKEIIATLDTESFIFDVQGDLSQDLNHKTIQVAITSNNELEITINKNENNLNNVFEFLQTKNIQVSSLRNSENRLEKVFVNFS